MIHGVIMAGGKGTRFWPESRKRKPKQFLRIGSEAPMLRETLARLGPLVPPERCYLVLPEELARGAMEIVPEVPRSNLIREPDGRNTAPCLGLAAAILAARDPEAVMVALPADHHVGNRQAFLEAIAAADEACRRERALVTFGVVPTRVETGYGYIQAGEVLAPAAGHTVRRVKRFVEKPARERALEYLASGEYLWNSGIFVWRVADLLAEIRTHLPRLGGALDAILAAAGTPSEGDVVHRVWPEVESVSIDVGIMEKAARVLVLPVDFPWNDVGSWLALEEVLPAEEIGVARVEARVGIDASGCILWAPGKLVAAIGIADLVIVDTEDALLVCHKERAQDVKRIVEILAEKGLDKYL